MLLTKFLFLIGSLGLSYLLCKTFIRFANNLGIVNRGAGSNQMRWSTTAKPLVGGIVFFLAFLIGSLVYAWLPEDKSGANGMLTLITGSVIGFVVGLVDDAYTTRPFLKLFGQLLISGVFLIGGVYINLSGVYLLDAALTIFWVVGILNSINMLDNMDGVTGATSAVIIAGCIAVSTVTGVYFAPLTFAMLTVLGALVGFLLLNWNPAKLYMGDTGSQFLGAFLAFIGIKYLWNLPLIYSHDNFTWLMQIALPLSFFIIPIIDTTTVTVARIRRGQSPAKGGRDHTTHHLAYAGLPQGFVALIFAVSSIFSMVLALWLLSASGTLSWWQPFVLLVNFSLIFGIVLWYYHVGLAKQKLRNQHIEALKPKVEVSEVITTEKITLR